VSAEPIANTQLLRLQVTGTDLEESTRLANAIAQAYVDQTQEMLVQPYAARLAALEAEITRQSVLIENAQAEIQVHTLAKLQNESKRSQLQSQLSQDSNDYRVLQQDYEQLRLTATQASESLVIVELAQEPRRAARNHVQYVLLAALVAMLAALGIACLIEYLRESFRTPEDVSRVLGLSTFGMIEQFGKEEEKLIVASQPQSPVAEAFRVLAANIRLSSMDGHFRTILVTSPSSAEGKSVVTANLAVAMANAGLRVVVVDADLRLPQIHRLFGLNRGQGLIDALWQGSADGNLKSTKVEGVKVLTSGTLPLDPVEAVSSPHMKKLLAGLSQEADLVIIDSPPVLAVADATILAAGVDGVLLVLRAGHTGGRSARHAVEALRQARTQLLGAVLNAVPVRKRAYHRYYGTTDETADNRSPLRKAHGLFP
jgi:tyrosine-protein kinase